MNILSAIGHTPLVKFNNLIENSKVKIFGKLEGCNPGGSIKDRPAYYMIKKAEESGELSRDNIRAYFRKYRNCSGYDRSSKRV